VVNVFTFKITLNYPIFYPHRIHILIIDLITNSSYFHLQHELLSVIEMECVYCAVRTEHLNIIWLM